jgi:hypothetical protein
MSVRLLGGSVLFLASVVARSEQAKLTNDVCSLSEIENCISFEMIECMGQNGKSCLAKSFYRRHENM